MAFTMLLNQASNRKITQGNKHISTQKDQIIEIIQVNLAHSYKANVISIEYAHDICIIQEPYHLQHKIIPFSAKHKFPQRGPIKNNHSAYQQRKQIYNCQLLHSPKMKQSNHTYKKSSRSLIDTKGGI